MKIFSYNVYGLPFNSDSLAVPLADWFEGCDYDFICLQEVFTTGRIDVLTKALVKNGYAVLKPDDFKARTNLLGSGLLTGIKKRTWKIKSDTFVQFNSSVGAECLANKGFHCIEIEHKTTKLPLHLINTHMQSDNPTTYIFGCIDTKPIRHSQTQQLYDHLAKYKNVRSLIVGDLNCEIESHDKIKHLTGQMNGILKHTFMATGEDLDHVAIIPEFWKRFKIPIVRNVSVLTKLSWSDHWPIHVELDLGRQRK
jgi:exonuclease III